MRHARSWIRSAWHPRILLASADFGSPACAASPSDKLPASTVMAPMTSARAWQLHWPSPEAALQILAAGLRYVSHDPNYQDDMDEDGGSDEEEDEDYAE